MKKIEKCKNRVYQFLRKQMRKETEGWTYDDAPDPRQQAKVKHSMPSIILALELGLLSCQKTLRDVEEMLGNLGSWTKKLVPEQISDTTLDIEVQRLDSGYLLKKLILRVRDFHRSKMLKPQNLPCGVVTVDGKNLATLNHDADGTAQKRSQKNEKWHLDKVQETKQGTSYYLMPALRAVLTSAEAKPCIYQLPLAPKMGESTMFPELLQGLINAYGRSGMFRIVDADAGLTSLRNATLIVDSGFDYVLGLKGNQQELFEEAKILFLEMMQTQAPELTTPWEHRNGKRIRRLLWRTHEMQGMENSVGKWSHLSQTWIVRQETQGRGGKIEIEDRYFITSLPWDYLRPEQILLLVRNHWGVENDCFNSLDLQWMEDSGPWCTQSMAIWNLGLLRIMAYNTVQILRRRRLRMKKSDGTLGTLISWRSLFKLIEKSLEFEMDNLCTE
jgi:hypothetical protein